jgi:hypothetical protein
MGKESSTDKAAKAWLERMLSIPWEVVPPRPQDVARIERERQQAQEAKSQWLSLEYLAFMDEIERQTHEND